MGKNWTKIATVNDMPSSKGSSKTSDRKAQNIIRNTKSLSYDDLYQETLDTFAEKQARKDFLMAGFEEKRLKSKKLIKEATKIKLQQEKNNKKKNENNAVKDSDNA